MIYRYDIARAVPVYGSASYASVAEKVGLSENLVFRIIRQAISNNVFFESTPGKVSRTVLSRLMATDPQFLDGIGLHTEEFTPASVKFIDALQKYGDPEEPNESAFSVAHSPEKKMSIFEIMGNDPKRVKRFGNAMQSYTSSDTWQVRHVFDTFDWSTIDKPGTIVVDVGGGTGHVSEYLACRTTSMRFIVQDLPHVASAAKAPDGLEDRITFMAQSFLEAQRLESPPDIIILRWILHNWSDKYAVQILRNLVPVMKKGAKVLIIEHVLDEEPVTDATKKFGLNMDMVMMVGFSGKERNARQYEELLMKADERFMFEGVKNPLGSAMAAVVVGWRE